YPWRLASRWCAPSQNGERVSLLWGTSLPPRHRGGPARRFIPTMRSAGRNARPFVATCVHPAAASRNVTIVGVQQHGGELLSAKGQLLRCNDDRDFFLATGRQ